MGDLIPNSTQIPNTILDVLMADLPVPEYYCLLYVCRRTYGFRKKKDRISLTQFVRGLRRRDGTVVDKGTGLSRQAVVDGLATLVAARLILRTQGKRGSSYEVNVIFDPNAAVRAILRLREDRTAVREHKVSLLPQPELPVE